MFFKRVCNERVLPMPEERELVGKFSWCNFDREWDSLHFLDSKFFTLTVTRVGVVIITVTEY
jgi:hypothetical protein